MPQMPEVLASCRFYLELKLDGSQDPVDGYFVECKGFKRNQQPIECTEVTPQKWGKANRGQVVRTKLPGNPKSTNLVLRRGLTVSMTFWKWFEAVEQNKWKDQRKNGSLSVYDQAGVVQARFEFQGAWPTGYTLTDFSASANEIEIEEVELAVEEFTRSQ